MATGLVGRAAAAAAGLSVQISVRSLAAAQWLFKVKKRCLSPPNTFVIFRMALVALLVRVGVWNATSGFAPWTSHLKASVIVRSEVRKISARIPCCHLKVVSWHRGVSSRTMNGEFFICASEGGRSFLSRWFAFALLSVDEERHHGRGDARVLM